MLKRFIAIFAPKADTTPEMLAAEAAIELDAVPESVRRARTMVGRGEYCLGAGRTRGALEPWTDCAHPTKHRHRASVYAETFCDCSGFLCAMWGIPRHNPDDTWNNTDHLERLARRQGIAWMHAQPGDGIVYGAGRAIGHCGLIANVGEGGPLTVIHCSASGRHAVKEEGMGLWRRKGALIVRRP